jgi:hypothetical protein
MTRIWSYGAAVLAVCLSAAPALPDPIAPEGYLVENYAGGIGAANALAIGPDGLLYITDYARGQLLKRTESGALEVIASGLQAANGLAILPNGRIFVTANDFYVYEIVSGSPQLFAAGAVYHTSLAFKGDDLYVSSSGDNRILKISTLTGTVTTLLDGVTNPFGISFDALGTMYFISHASGQLYSHNFSGVPSLLVSFAPYAGTYTGFGFDGRLFWGNYQDASLNWLKPDGSPEVFATGFAGGGSPPAIGPNGIVADGPDKIYVADGVNVWKIWRRPEAAAALQERAMQIRQSKTGEWMVACSVQYTGVSGNHPHTVALDIVGPGIGVGPFTATLGPARRSAALAQAGVQSARYVLTPTQLWLERTVYLASPPVRGDLYYCEGSGQDVTAGKYLRTTHMEDSSY